MGCAILVVYTLLTRNMGIGEEYGAVLRVDSSWV